MGVADLRGLTTLSLDLYRLSADVGTLTGSHEALHWEPVPEVSGA
ncbi:hypothetical protein BH09ACT6_BH09ACT6_08290 [soil metagenome]